MDGRPQLATSRDCTEWECHPLDSTHAPDLVYTSYISHVYHRIFCELSLSAAWNLAPLCLDNANHGKLRDRLREFIYFHS